MKKILSNIFLLLLCLPAFAQDYQEEIKGGNKAYAKKNYAEAEVAYKKALEAKENPIEGTYNLGNSLYKQDRFEEAEAQYQQAIQMAKDNDTKADAYHNLGNTYLKQEKVEEAIKAYKDGLKLNPTDEQTRYNLAKTIQYQKQQEQQEQEQKQDQKKDEDKKDEKDQDKGDGEKAKKDPNDGDPKDEDDKKDKGDKEKEDKEKQDEKGDNKNAKPKPGEISREDAERLLQALAREEQELQKKMNEEKIKTKPIKTEKDW